MSDRARSGAALVLSLLVTVVLECVVLGTVYLALQERRLADNAEVALRLRLAAESAVAEAAAVWPAWLDTARNGSIAAGRVAQQGFAAQAFYQRVDSTLTLVYAEVAEPAPRAGRARAARLIEPPLLPPGRVPAAALHAGPATHVRLGARVSATPLRPCADDSVGSADAIRSSDIATLMVDDTSALAGTLAQAPFAADFAFRAGAIAAHAAPLATHDSLTGRFTLTSPSSGVLAVAGDLTIARDVAFVGLVLVTGSVSIEPGAVIDGVVIAGGAANVAGTLRLSRCAALAAARRSGLLTPVPHPTRPAMPAF